MRPTLLIVIFLLVIGSCGLTQQAAPEDRCARTAHMQVYSNAYLSEETGDVGGFELALRRHTDSTVDALLYVYEGAPNDDGIPLSGHIVGEKLTVEGTWTEHLVEYPSKEEIVQPHLVKIVGTLGSASFAGRIEIEGMASNGEKSRLKRLGQIWLCVTHKHGKP
jgi:hypothetical protein